MENRYRESVKFLERALRVIPLASQTFSKSITQFPRGVSPLFLERGQGSRVWDVDGNEYIDFMNALLSVTLGYNDTDVTKAVQQQIENGVSFSLPHRLETEVAEMIVELFPCAEMVRFGKNGTDATSAAIRIARAYTDRDHVAVCGYHGWQDWYIGSTTRNLGVPKVVRELTHPFSYNDLESLQKLFKQFPGQIAAVIMEPMTVTWPQKGFLEDVKNLAGQNGAVLIFDEIITGCRFARGGAQELFNVTPDLVTIGKGLANGFPLSAVAGRKEIMLFMEKIFFSGTFGGETASLAAAKVVLNKIVNENVVEILIRQGKKVIYGVTQLIKKHKVEHIFSINGHPTWSFLLVNDVKPYNKWDINTLLFQELFSKGIIAMGSHNMSCAHTDKDLTALLDVYDEVFPVVRHAVENKSIPDLLRVEPLKPLFKVR